MASKRSIVEYFAEHEGYRCGYCGSSDTNYSHGMWAHSMTVQDYQDLIDRGWRRSGKYCYKPTMNKTCCPQYTIRCDALGFKPSKSHKKVIKRVNRYLITGQKPGGKEDDDSSTRGAEGGPSGDSFVRGKESEFSLSASDVKSDVKSDKTVESVQVQSSERTAQKKVKVDTVPCESENSASVNTCSVENKPAKSVSSQGADSSKPPCRKAKQQRLERRMQKTGLSLDQMKTKNQAKKNEGKSLEELLNEPQLAENPAHHLEVRLVRTSPPSTESRLRFSQSHGVFQKYQMSVHKEEAEECSKQSYQQFLVDSPLQPNTPEEGQGGLPEGYGSFHQHYLLDGKLIAVGVVDILTHCISSVYLYYDPAYSFLSLGTYSALRELAFTRELQKKDPALQYYYMGFYLHKCPKMRYKGQYHPSDIVCPEVFSWVPIEKCVPKLDASNYSRLDEPGKSDPESPVDINKVLVLQSGEAMSYEVYTAMKPRANDRSEVQEYANLVGNTCAQRMLLFRK